MSGRDLDHVPSEAAGLAVTPAGAVEVGELLALEDAAVPLLLLRGRLRRARTAIDLHGGHVGREVVVALEGGDPERPIVLGVLRTGNGEVAGPVQDLVEMDLDGERLLIEARRELVLRCGKASITLTRSGKVLIDGSYVLSRSRGANRIKGGSVQIN
jgi:hypothetical protein